MKPYHWESHHGNFGDDLNLWLWDFLLPGLRDVHPDVLLVGVVPFSTMFFSHPLSVNLSSAAVTATVRCRIFPTRNCGIFVVCAVK